MSNIKCCYCAIVWLPLPSMEHISIFRVKATNCLSLYPSTFQVEKLLIANSELLIIHLFISQVIHNYLLGTCYLLGNHKNIEVWWWQSQMSCSVGEVRQYGDEMVVIYRIISDRFESTGRKRERVFKFSCKYR